MELELGHDMKEEYVAVDEDKLLKIVTHILQTSNLDALRPPDLRRQCEQQLNLANGKLDEKPLKKKIRQMIADFVEQQEDENTIEERNEQEKELLQHIKDNENKREKEKNDSKTNDSQSILDIDTNWRDDYHIYESNDIKHCIMLNQVS